MWRDETPLTAEEIRELDAYCAKLHIELVPSIATFGHLYMLLSTKSYGDLCEFPDSWKEPFSFWDRMQHHTVDVSGGRAIELIKAMIEEYMALLPRINSTSARTKRSTLEKENRNRWQTRKAFTACISTM